MMSWLSAQKSGEFLDYVNRYVRFVDGELERIPHDERRGQITLAFVKSQQLIFTIDIDLVIEGYCASYVDTDATIQFPMGECKNIGDKEDDPYRSWLHEVIRENRARKVLLYSQCCGPYSSQFKDLLHRAFPEVEWHIPCVYDLYDNVHTRLDQLCRYFIKAGIMAASNK